MTYNHLILYTGPGDHDDILYILVSIIYKVYSIFERYSVLKLLLDHIIYIFLIRPNNSSFSHLLVYFYLPLPLSISLSVSLSRKE